MIVAFPKALRFNLDEAKHTIAYNAVASAAAFANGPDNRIGQIKAVLADDYTAAVFGVRAQLVDYLQGFNDVRLPSGLDPKDFAFQIYHEEVRAGAFWLIPTITTNVWEPLWK